MIEPQGFIQEFKDIILDSISCSPEWAELCAMGTLAGVLKNVRTSTRKGPMNLNIFALTIGPSGIAHKSVVLATYVIPVLRKAGQIAFERAKAGIDGSEVTRINYDVILPPDYSIEGMVEYMSKHRSTGVIVKDEFTTLIKNSRSSGYLHNITEFTGKLFDGFLQKRYTRKTGLDHAVSCNVSMLATTTPYFYKILNDEFFNQGLGNRFIYDLYPDAPIMDTKPISSSQEYRDERMENIHRLAKHLSEWIYLGNDIDLWMNLRPSTEDVLNAFYVEMEALSHTYLRENKTGLMHSFVSRIYQIVHKLACLHAVSRVYKDVEKVTMSTQMMVEVADAEWAIERGRMYIKSFERMLTARYVWGTETQPVITIEGSLNHAIAVLKLSGGTMDRKTFRRKLNINAKDFDLIIGELMERDYIVETIGPGSPSGGPKPTIYTLTFGSR